MSGDATRYQKLTAYSAMFVAVTWGGILCIAVGSILWESITHDKENESFEIRREHLAQHDSEHEQFKRMIELLEQISAKLDTR